MQARHPTVRAQSRRRPVGAAFPLRATCGGLVLRSRKGCCCTAWQPVPPSSPSSSPNADRPQPHLPPQPSLGWPSESAGCSQQQRSLILAPPPPLLSLCPTRSTPPTSPPIPSTGLRQRAAGRYTQPCPLTEGLSQQSDLKEHNPHSQQYPSRTCIMGLPAPGGPGLGASGAAQTNRCC